MEVALLYKLIDGGNGGWVFTGVVMPCKDAARLELGPPFLKRLSGVLSGVGIAVDVNEVEGFIRKQGSRFGKGQAQRRAALGPHFGQQIGSMEILAHVVMILPAVNRPQSVHAATLQDLPGVFALGHAKLDALAFKL